MKLKFVLVDLDGTLIDNRRLEAEVLRQFYQKISKKLKISKKRAKEIFWKIGKELEGKKEWYDWRIYSNKLKLGDFWKNAYKKALKYLKVRKEAKKFLKGVKKLGLKPVIVSNAIKEVVNWKVEKAKLSKFIFKRFSQDDTKCCKKEVKYFRIILRKLRVKPKEVLLIDNSVESIKSARRLGIKTILIKKFEHSKYYLKESKKVKSDYEVKNLVQALKIIKSLAC